MNNPTLPTLAEATRCILACELAEPLPGGVDAVDSPAEQAASRPDANAVALPGNILVFTEGMSSQNKQDVMDSMLFASLAADRQFRPDVLREQWYERYTQVLRTLGWVTHSARFSDYRTQVSRFTMEQAALDILAAAVKAAVLPGATAMALQQAAKDTFAALKAQEKPLRLFESHYKGHRQGGFVVGACHELSDGTPNAVIGVVKFAASSQVTQLLFNEWTRTQVSLHHAEDSVALAMHHYAGLRDLVRGKLGASALAAVEAIDI